MTTETKRLKRYYRMHRKAEGPTDPFKAYVTLFPEGEAWRARKRGAAQQPRRDARG